MNFRRVYICGIISLLWWLSEALSIRVYENVSELHDAPLKLNASPTQNINPVLPTIPGREVKFGEPHKTSAKLPEINTTESIVKAHILVADNEKITLKLSSGLSGIEQENAKKSGKMVTHGIQQKWQIPSLSSASDPKSINSSKRQTEDNFQVQEFVPSLQVGLFDDTQGFVPHNSYHEPKGITYAHTVYGLKKPIKDDNNEGDRDHSMNSFSEQNNNEDNHSNYGYGDANQPYNSLSESRIPANNFGVSGILTNSYGEPRLPIHDLDDFKLPINSYEKTKFTTNGEKETVQNVNSYGLPDEGTKLLTNNFDESRLQSEGFGQSRIPNGGGDGIRFPINDLHIQTNGFDSSKQAFNNDISGLKLPSNGAGPTFRKVNGLQAFQNDFDILKNKYPELNELVNNYPLMEEMMKQKLAEKFQHNFQFGHHSLSSAENPYGGNGFEEAFGERLKLNDQTKLYVTNFKFPSTEDAKVKIPDVSHLIGGRPFQYEFDKPNWSFQGKKPAKFEEDNSHEVPAGEIYQGSKFPVTSYAFDDHKHGSEDHKHGVEEQKKPEHVVGSMKHGISPWKKVLHLLTAFIPVGILISALTPSIVNINNTADRTYPIRQRSLHSTPSTAVASHLLEIIKGSMMSDVLQHQDSEDPGCDDRNFCEMARRGEHPTAMVVEKIFWNLAHNVPGDVAKRAGMKRLFKAIKSGDCNKFICKKPQSTNTTVPTQEVPSALEEDKSEKEEVLTESYVDDDGNHFATTTGSPIIRRGVLKRGKRVHN